MTIRDYLKKHGALVTDGAMGTYCSLIREKQNDLVESVTAQDPETVRRIHREYLQAGARMLNSNTFAANTYKMEISRQELKDLLKRAYRLAREEAAPFGAFVAADIGPLPEMEDTEEITLDEVMDEYRFIIDCFLEEGAMLFNFETFSTAAYAPLLAGYVKSQRPDAFVICSFAVNSSGTTLRGLSIQRIFDELSQEETIDGIGLNCGTGPTHLFDNLSRVDFGSKIVSLVPNASYPEIIDGRIVYSQNPDYFAEFLVKARDLGVQILGGCCGTTPDHIRALSRQLAGRPQTPVEPVVPKPRRKAPRSVGVNRLAEKIQQGRFVIAVELPPPGTPDVRDILEMARMMKEAGADVVTFSDSPLGRARTNPIALSAKIRREVGIETLPHMCCRDRNIIAIKSDLMGAYMEQLHNVLLVTGDPIPAAERNEITSIFNLNSFKLIELVANMNADLFRENPFVIAGALDLNVPQPDKAVARMARKHALGARYFMTQPIYEQRVVDYIREQHLNRDHPILAGIMPVVNYRNARFLDNEIPGINIPGRVMERFWPEMSREKGELTGTRVAWETIEQLLDHVSGIYLVTPLNRIRMVEKLVRKIRNLI